MAQGLSINGESLRSYRTGLPGNEAKGARHFEVNPLHIDPPDPASDNDDASFYKAWNVAPAEMNLAKVLRAWRSQEVGP